MDNFNFDVVIAGAGAGGLYTAINLPSNLNILVLAKKELTLCNSSLAQGGIAAVYNPPDDDTTQLHTNDTLIAGGFRNNTETVKILVNSAAEEIDKIISYGVDFDKNPDGSLHRTLEGGHCRNRIFHHKDSTGAELVNKLSAKVKTLSNVTIWENSVLSDIKETETGFSFDILKDNERVNVASHFAVIATGGIGRVYEYTTNSAISTGDGIAIAHRMGAAIQNLKLIQFHPTAFNDFSQRECFLLSESLRGEGAYLLNCNMERFMHRYDDRLELAPRDVVSHSIIEESRKTSSKKFFLDISYQDADEVKERFPMIYKNLLENGYDLTKEPIPVYPCQHYLMGGIDVDKFGRTSIENLYAVGECSHTGVHGNNRLASNSLLEALVFSNRVAEDIKEKMGNVPENFMHYEFPENTEGEELPTGLRTEIRHIMQSTYFVIPESKEVLLNGFERVKEIKRTLDKGNFALTRDYIEARSLATIAYIILKEVI